MPSAAKAAGVGSTASGAGAPTAKRPPPPKIPGSRSSIPKPGSGTGENFFRNLIESVV